MSGNPTDFQAPAPNNLWTARFTAGKEGSPGINISATVNDNGAGQTAWVQLMDWKTRIIAAADPDPAQNRGAGEYERAANGLDTDYPLTPVPINVFADSPSLAFLANTPGQGGKITHRADFKTHLLWVSNRPKSLPATLRRVNWTWAFTADAQFDGEFRRWGAPQDTSSRAGAQVTSEIPEWEKKVIISSVEWKKVVP